ncbi:unnamed protein product [Colias eurytheme]|nr:unnamed protein product [Colias eurytheme]
MSATQAEEESAVEEVAVGAIGSAPARNTYREKSASTVVRVLTVFAYLFSVSFAAILLSVYYICVWKSPELTEAQGQVSARRADDFDYRPTFTGDNETFNFTEVIDKSDKYNEQLLITNVTRSGDYVSNWNRSHINVSVKLKDKQMKTEACAIIMKQQSASGGVKLQTRAA